MRVVQNAMYRGLVSIQPAGISLIVLSEIRQLLRPGGMARCRGSALSCSLTTDDQRIHRLRVRSVTANLSPPYSAQNAPKVIRRPNGLRGHLRRATVPESVTQGPGKASRQGSAEVKRNRRPIHNDAPGLVSHPKEVVQAGRGPSGKGAKFSASLKQRANTGPSLNSNDSPQATKENRRPPPHQLLQGRNPPRSALCDRWRGFLCIPSA